MRRPRDPDIELGQILPSIRKGAFPGPDTARDCRCKFGPGKIADKQRVRISQHERVRKLAKWLRSQQGDENTRIEIAAYRCHSSSRISLTSVPASILAGLLPTRLARSHSISALVIGRGAGRTGFSSTTGSPRRVMTIGSP